MPERRLVLVRHAEAGQALTDRDRPLTERGRHQAAAVGSWLAQAGIVPQRVLVSPASRALQTWDGVREGLPAAPERIEDERLYENTVEAVLESVQQTADDVPTLLVVGHNPSVAQLIRLLDDGAGSPEARERLSAGFAPASVAVLDVAGRFADLGEGGAELVDAIVPGG